MDIKPEEFELFKAECEAIRNSILAISLNCELFKEFKTGINEIRDFIAVVSHEKEAYKHFQTIVDKKTTKCTVVQENYIQPICLSMR